MEFKSNWDEQGLLIAFLTALFHPFYINQCTEDMGFIPVSNSLAYDAKMIFDTQLPTSPDVPTWTFESYTRVVEGQGLHVISSKRSSNKERRIQELVDNQVVMMDYIKMLQSQVQALETTVEELRVAVGEKEKEILIDALVAPSIQPLSTPLPSLVLVTVDTDSTSPPTMEQESNNNISIALEAGVEVAQQGDNVVDTEVSIETSGGSDSDLETSSSQQQESASATSVRQTYVGWSLLLASVLVAALGSM